MSNVRDVEIERFISIRQVEKIVGLSKSSIWRRIERGEFPRPAWRERTQKNPDQWGVTRWSLEDILNWRESKLGAAKQPEARAA
jgi:predicted DNA-binding transcriptional regulator AlpA